MSTRPEQLEQLTAYLDDELSSEERARVERLLASDAEARALLEDLRRTANFVQRLPRGSAPSDLVDRVNVRLERAALLGESARSVPMPAARRPRWIRPFAFAASLLLACTICWLAYRGPMKQQSEMQVAWSDGAQVSEEAMKSVASPRPLRIEEERDARSSSMPALPTMDKDEESSTADVAMVQTPAETATAAVAMDEVDAKESVQGQEPFSAFERLFSAKGTFTPPTTAAESASLSFTDSSGNDIVVRADTASAQALAKCIGEFSRGNLLVASAENVKDTSRFLGQPYCIEPPAAAATYGGGGFAASAPSDTGRSMRYVLSLSESQLPQLAAAMDRVALSRGSAPAITVNGARTGNMQLAALSVRPAPGVQSPGRLRATSAARPTERDEAEAQGMGQADAPGASGDGERAKRHAEGPPEAKAVMRGAAQQDSRKNVRGVDVGPAIVESPSMRLINVAITIVPADDAAVSATPAAAASTQPMSPRSTAVLNAASQPASQEFQRGQE